MNVLGHAENGPKPCGPAHLSWQVRVEVLLQGLSNPFLLRIYA